MRERMPGQMMRVQVGIEAYDLKFAETEEQLREYCADPAGYMRRFFEAQGQVVNRVDFIHRSSGESSRGTAAGPVVQRMPDRTYHLTAPAIEASGWICCCAD